MKSSDISQRPFPESCIKIWSVELDLLNLPQVWGRYRLELGFQSKIPIKKTFDQPKLIHNSGLQPNPKPNPTQPIQEIIFESLYLSLDLIESNQTWNLSSLGSMKHIQVIVRNPSPSQEAPVSS